MSAGILVTGATGFIGSALVARLLRHGRSVRAVVRSDAVREPMPRGMTRIIVADLATHTDWNALLDGVDAVVHLAGAAHLSPSADAAIHETSNVVATERLAAAASRAGVRRFLFLSSAKVHGEQSQGRAFSETDAADPRDAYARSKVEAESRLLAIAGASSLEPVILRPPLVYGPGVKANFLALLKLVDAGLPLPLGAIHNRRSLLYLGNLVDAIETCLAHPGAAGNIFLASDGNPVSTPELVRAIAAGLHRPERLFSLPASLLAAAAALTGQRARLERLTESFEVDASKLRSTLGWRPPHGFSESVAETCRWFAAARA
jgi:nucleoside-diphosphate-sugar epimerase